jgi:hypothetical protein
MNEDLADGHEAGYDARVTKSFVMEKRQIAEPLGRAGFTLGASSKKLLPLSHYVTAEE